MGCSPGIHCCKGVPVGAIRVFTGFSSQLAKTSVIRHTTCPQRQLRMVGVRMGRNGIMIYPSIPHCGPGCSAGTALAAGTAFAAGTASPAITASASGAAGGTSLGATTASSGASGPSQGGAAGRCNHAASGLGGSGSNAAGSGSSHRGLSEGDHQLEKLQFALAVALTRGDLQRSEQLRQQINALGGNREEPGT
jgi:hypothetical protein